MLAEQSHVHLEYWGHVNLQFLLQLAGSELASLRTHDDVAHVLMRKLVVVCAAVDELAVWQPNALNAFEVLVGLGEDSY